MCVCVCVCACSACKGQVWRSDIYDATACDLVCFSVSFWLCTILVKKIGHFGSAQLINLLSKNKPIQDAGHAEAVRRRGTPEGVREIRRTFVLGSTALAFTHGCRHAVTNR